MRFLPLLFLALILVAPLQESNASVHMVAGIVSDKIDVKLGDEFLVCVFVNVTVYYNETPTDLRNGSIKINVTMKIPEGLNVTRLSYGSLENETIKAFRENATFAELYVRFNATKEGDYSLSARVNVTYSITARAENATAVYLNDTISERTNIIRVHVYAEQPEEQEERNRLGLYDSLRSRVLQIILGLTLLGLLLNNFIADLKAKRS